MTLLGFAIIMTNKNTEFPLTSVTFGHSFFKKERVGD